MAYNPGVSFFIQFRELDPSKHQKCIFFTQKGTRCRRLCRNSDNSRAIELHKTITACSSEAVTIDLLKEYALCNCCRSSGTQHRDRIEDIGLLVPLAQRWQNEIWTHAATLTKNHSEPRYALRHRQATVSQLPLSEFRPHLVNPGPNDSVAQKILKPLKPAEHQSGWLYIFNRDSSPGHVKIGWTANSVSRRLEDWSKCGYTPNLLFSVDKTPHALRVETLTHYELIKEWRRERQCKAKHCGKSHQEWFEINKERAIQVLSDWAYLIQNAKPYDLDGQLTTRWINIVKMIGMSGMMVNAEQLLKHYKASLVEKAALIQETTNQAHVPKIEGEVRTKYRPELGRPVAIKKASAGANLLQTEAPTLPQTTPLLKSEILSKKPLLSTKGKLSKIDPLPKTETLPTMQFSFTAGASSNTRTLLKATSLGRAGSLLETELLPGSELTYKEVLAGERLLNGRFPKQVPPFSSTVQSTNIFQDTRSSHVTRTSLSTGPGTLGATDIATKSATDIAIVDTLSSPKIRSSIPMVTLASRSATSSGDISQTNSCTRIDITTYSPLPHSDPSSKPNPIESPTSVASSRVKVELIPDSPAPPVLGISNELLSISNDGQDKREIETLALTPQFEQNPEASGQPEPEIELFQTCRQTCKEEVNSHGRDRSISAQNKPGTDEWDADETLVGDQTMGSLEKMTLKIVDGLYDDISTDKAIKARKDLEEPRVLRCEQVLS